MADNRVFALGKYQIFFFSIWRHLARWSKPSKKRLSRKTSSLLIQTCRRLLIKSTYCKQLQRFETLRQFHHRGYKPHLRDEWPSGLASVSLARSLRSSREIKAIQQFCEHPLISRKITHTISSRWSPYTEKYQVYFIFFFSYKIWRR